MSNAILAWLALASASLTSAQRCPLVFDGRLPATSCVTSFNHQSSPFLADFVFGQNQSFGEVVKLPHTASDTSIFAPNLSTLQTGFRRTELIPNTTGASTIGKKTLHFSLAIEPHRPLNYSHEYQLVFLETATFNTNQFALKTGRVAEIVAKNPNMDPERLYFQGNVEGPEIQTLFETWLSVGGWVNFGVVLDFDRNTTQILHSTSFQPLKAVTKPIANDLSGNGQYHFGVLKKPTGENLMDVTTYGFQESGIDEGIVYGGIFQEDSVGGCVSLSPGSGKRSVEERAV